MSKCRFPSAFPFSVPPTHDGVETSGVISVTQGESVTLPCDVMGNPPPSITWLKDGQALGLSGRNYYTNPNGGLVIQQMSLTDEAEYTCMASNVAGNSTRDIRITILSECNAHLLFVFLFFLWTAQSLKSLI